MNLIETSESGNATYRNYVSVYVDTKARRRVQVSCHPRAVALIRDELGQIASLLGQSGPAEGSHYFPLSLTAQDWERTSLTGWIAPDGCDPLTMQELRNASRRRPYRRVSDPSAGSPGDCGNSEWPLGKQRAATVAQGLERRLVQGPRVRAGGPDAERERLPPFLEACVLAHAGDLPRLDVAQPRRHQHPGEVPLAGARQVRFVLDARVELPRGAPERRERRPTAPEVPDARGDDAIRPRDAGSRRRRQPDPP